MSRAVVVAGLVAVLAGGGYVAWDLLGPPTPRERLTSLRDTLRARRAAADSCRRVLSYEEASFQDYDERIDSLRERVRGYEALDPEGVPADSYGIYLEAFDRYNDAVPGWEARAESLEAVWQECRALVREHNEMADSVRRLLVDLGLVPDTGLSDEEALRIPARGSGAERPDDSSAGEVVATAEDWRILEERVSWARDQGLDTVPVGEAVARLGLTFVGTPYVPGTLEVGEPERTVVNLRGLDCVTLVESVLAIVDVVRNGPVAGPDPAALRASYVRSLERIRYRDGVLAGYPSRLHYFSEWIRNGDEKGIVRSVTPDLDPVVDREPLSFMSAHPEAYPQLARPDHLRAIRALEASLSARPRHYVPEEAIEALTDRIRTGDVIAATSTVEGLDVAHTGIAVWSSGRLHLLHAPLVGDSVQVSEEPLARRIARLEGQDGIMVARPVL